MESMEKLDSTEYVRLTPDDWQKLRDLRIQAVTEQPKAFGNTPQEELSRTEEMWRDRLEKKTYLFAQEGDSLVGMVSVVPELAEKTKHIANIYSMYVVPESRGKGTARTLLTRAIEEAKVLHPEIVKLELNVAVTQLEALQLYESLGFERAGYLRKELFVDGEFIDEIQMEKFVG